MYSSLLPFLITFYNFYSINIIQIIVKYSLIIVQYFNFNLTQSRFYGAYCLYIPSKIRISYDLLMIELLGLIFL